MKALWRELVPPMNQADTKQGELVRCIGNLEDESSRNGNANWDELNEEEIEFLSTHLPDAAVFSAEQCEQIRNDLKQVLAAGRSGHGEGEDFENHFTAEDIVFDRLTWRVVDWCDANPEPILLNPPDPNIRRFEK